MVEWKYPRTARVIITFTINGSDWGAVWIGSGMNTHIVCKKVKVISDMPHVTAELYKYGEMRIHSRDKVAWRPINETCIVEGIFEITSADPLIMRTEKGDIGSTRTTIQWKNYDNTSPCCGANRVEFSVPTTTWLPPCLLTTLTNINFPTSVPAIEDLKGNLTLKNPDNIVRGVGRVKAINRDTGETMATTGEVELSAGQEAPIEFSMKMIYNILNLKLVAESLCLDKWKTDFTKDISISPLFAKATIGNLKFPVGQTHGEKFSISFDLMNDGVHGLARLRILDMDTNKEVFSTGPTELSSSKAFTYSGTMPTVPLNLRLVAESVGIDNKWYEDAYTDISLKSLCREGAIKVIDFLQGRVITEICKAGEWVENLPPTLKIIDITTPSFSKLGELFKVEVKCRNEGGMGASMVADQQFDILGGETKTVAYTLKMPVVDEHLFKIDARSLHSDGKWHTDDTKEKGVRAMDALISEIGTGKLTMATGSKSVSFKVAVRGREVEILGKKIPFGVTEVVVGKIAPYSSFDIEGKGIHYIRTRTTLPLVLAEDRKIIGEGRDYVFSSFKRPFTYMASKTKAVFRG